MPRLVLLPALVVLALVFVIVVVGWLTLAPGDVDELVDQLQQEGRPRWQAAVHLAGALAGPDGDVLKDDPRLAARLAAILHRELQAGSIRDEDIMLRMYLARALGEFRLETPLAVLVEAAATGRDPAEIDVQRSAVEGLAVMASHLGPQRLRRQAGLIEALQKAARSKAAPLRATAAFTLGVVGSARADASLARLLGDEHPDVRYNAATGLARHGNAGSVEVLLEMLDPDQTAALEVERQEAARKAKRRTILLSALEAVRQLARANPELNTGELAAAVERLDRAEVDPAVRAKAAAVLQALENPREAATGS